ncbi:hypothetical protein EVAR_60334_1 [Eumeta japonica]|uniref:Uncharacterized protein n=1 Tax=Eumeta variegata TaxID=151549 RepID=A0A4C1ZAK6_EUMVA|nr:hypothetical protein EVAR_60334_1 [Eumeta japonica]
MLRVMRHASLWLLVSSCSILPLCFRHRKPPPSAAISINLRAGPHPHADDPLVGKNTGPEEILGEASPLGQELARNISDLTLIKGILCPARGGRASACRAK